MFGRGGGFDPFQQMNSMMRRQMADMEDLHSMMMDPFGMMGGGFGHRQRLNPRQQMIENDARQNPHRNGRGAVVGQRDPFGMLDDGMMMPFGGGFPNLLGGGLFGGMNNMMQQMEQQAINNPNCHVYTQSTVIGMAPGADGRLNYYESTDSVRKAGDVKEVRKSVRDTSKGVEKMSIGHHIGDRAHIIEKRRDKKGNIVENQEFVGLKEDDAHKFDREFASVSRQTGGGRNRLQHEGRRPTSRLEIEDVTSRPDRRDRDRNSSPYARASDRRKPRGPIIEEIE